MSTLEPDALARLAYEAYGNTVEWKNFRGDDMPEWHELPGVIQHAWTRSVVAVTSAVASAIGRIH